MKIIPQPSQRTACATCSAVLEFDITDIQINDIGHGPPPEYIRCPCHKNVAVKVPNKWLTTLYPHGS